MTAAQPVSIPPASDRTSAERRPRLALLSGLLCDEFVWKKQVERIGQRSDIRVFHFHNHETITQMAEDVLDVMPSPFFLAGHSMGGRVAFEVMRLSPQSVSGLALFNTGIHTVRDGEVEKRQRLVDLAFERGMAELARVWLPPMLSSDRLHDQALIMTLTDMVCRATPVIFERQIRALVARPDARVGLNRITCPTILATGTADMWSPLAQHEEMRDAIHGSRLVEIIGSGHMSLVESPSAVTDILRALMAPAMSGI